MPLPGPAMLPRDPNAGFQVQVADTTLSEATIVLRKRRWVLIFGVLLGGIFGMYRAWTQPQLYTATGEIQVRCIGTVPRGQCLLRRHGPDHAPAD